MATFKCIDRNISTGNFMFHQNTYTYNMNVRVAETGNFKRRCTIVNCKKGCKYRVQVHLSYGGSTYDYAYLDNINPKIYKEVDCDIKTIDPPYVGYGGFRQGEVYDRSYDYFYEVEALSDNARFVIDNGYRINRTYGNMVAYESVTIVAIGHQEALSNVRVEDVLINADPDLN